MICRECIAEHDGAVAAGQGRSLHRVAVYVFGAESFLRQEAMDFGDTPGAELTAYTALFVFLLGYAFVPVVSRRVEAVHSAIQTIVKRARCQLGSSIAAQVLHHRKNNDGHQAGYTS